jgi:hypothetical protein
MSEVPITLVSAVSRPAGIGREAFQQRWSELGEFGMSLPLWQHVRSYSQCPLVDGDKLGLSGTPLERMLPERYGGAAVFEFANEEELMRFLAHPDRPKLAHKYEHLLGVLATDPFVIGRGRRLIDREGAPGVKMFAFLRRRPQLSREQFLNEWHSFASANFVANKAVSNTIINYIQYQGLLDNEAAATGWDGAIENVFADTNAALTTVTASAASGNSARQTFFDESQAFSLLCTEAVVYDNAGERSARATVVSPSAR